MGFSDLCNAGLVLGLGLSAVESKKVNANHDQKLEEEEEEDDDHLGCKKLIISEHHHHHQPQTSLTLSLSNDHHRTSDKISTGYNVQLSGNVLTSAANPSISNVSGVKREIRDVNGGGDLEIETKISSSSRVVDEFDDDDDGSNGRKKLRLTKAQSALLEESFKHHSSLNPKQKQDLARDLKLRPRQVEVWFQNRRARTKLKQTEMDYALLKKCCETLTEENRRLQKEVQELKALKLAQSPLYTKIPPATLTVCPSCGGGSGGGAAKSAFTMALKPHFCNPLTDPSSAC